MQLILCVEVLCVPGTHLDAGQHALITLHTMPPSAGAAAVYTASGVSEAHVVILVCDGKEGVQSGDREVLDWLRQHHPDKPLLLAVNKCDNASRADLAAAEFWELGLQPYTLSSITGTGAAELLDAMKLVGGCDSAVSNWVATMVQPWRRVPCCLHGCCWQGPPALSTQLPSVAKQCAWAANDVTATMRLRFCPLPEGSLQLKMRRRWLLLLLAAPMLVSFATSICLPSNEREETTM